MRRGVVRRGVAAAVVALASSTLLAACTPKPLQDYTLPGGQATGSDGYTVTAYFANVGNLVTNAQVLYQNTVIGTVRSIRFDTSPDLRWRAAVRFSVLKSEPLPADITLKIGQKSLLGAEYLEIDAPARSGITLTGSLEQHADEPISEARTGAYPETEQVLAGAALLLGNGGLGQLKTITGELNKLLSGRSQQQAARGLITQLNSFFGTLNDQKGQIVDLIGAVDRLGALLAQQRGTISTALSKVDPGLRLLNAQRTHLTATLQSVSRLAVVGKQVIDESGPALTSNLRNLQPVLTALAEAGSDIPRALQELGAFPFPVATGGYSLRGDYGNLNVTVNLTLGELAKDFAGISPSALQDLLTAPSPAAGHANPVTGPLQLGSTTPATSGAGSAAAPSNPSTGLTTTPPATGSAGTGSSGTGSSGTGSSGTGSSDNGLCGLLGTLLGGC